MGQVNTIFSIGDKAFMRNENGKITKSITIKGFTVTCVEENGNFNRGENYYYDDDIDGRFKSINQKDLVDYQIGLKLIDEQLDEEKQKIVGVM